MEIKKQEIVSKAIKFEAVDGEKIIGRAFLYLINNELHEKPYGLLEDVFVVEDYRSRGIGTDLVKAIIEEAKNSGCYKLVGTSRHSRAEVHEWYKKLGFQDYGKEFRMDFIQ